MESIARYALKYPFRAVCAAAVLYMASQSILVTCFVAIVMVSTVWHVMMTPRSKSAAAPVVPKAAEPAAPEPEIEVPTPVETVYEKSPVVVPFHHRKGEAANDRKAANGS